MFNLKKITQIIFIFICSFSFVSLIFATYEYERQDIYDYKEFFDDLYPEEEKEESCSTIGTVYANCSGVTVGDKTISLALLIKSSSSIPSRYLSTISLPSLV